MRMERFRVGGGDERREGFAGGEEKRERDQ